MYIDKLLIFQNHMYVPNLCRMPEIDLLNVAANIPKMKAMKTFQLILVGSHVESAEIATCGYLLKGTSFEPGGVRSAKTTTKQKMVMVG
jgi:hypothetical protein